MGWYRKSAEQGNGIANAHLGDLYLRGIGVDKDASEALKWYRRAADLGDASGQRLAGWMYETGSGTPKDEAQAIKYYEEAANRGMYLRRRHSYGYEINRRENCKYPPRWAKKMYPIRS